MRNIHQLIYKLSEYPHEIKYKWQRAFRGYSSLDAWSIHSWFEEVMPRILSDYKKNLHGCPAQFTVRDDGQEYQSAEKGCEEWKAILDRMTFCFTEMNEESCSLKNEFDEEYHKQVFGDKNWDDLSYSGKWKFNKAEPELEQKYKQKRKEIYEYRTKMKDEGFDLLKKYFWNLWD